MKPFVLIKKFYLSQTTGKFNSHLAIRIVALNGLIYLIHLRTPHPVAPSQSTFWNDITPPQSSTYVV